MDLSIVICSYNRYSQLKEAVHAVEKSRSFDRDTMELIVVENTPRKMRQKLKFSSHTEVVVCNEPGLSNARNAGIAASHGGIVAFVDDDAIVDTNWCSSVIGAFKINSGAQVCGGRTIPRYTGEPRPRWYYDELSYYLSCIDWGANAHPLERGQWIVGANMAFRRTVFDKIGYFDPALGRKGEASLLSNEEIAMLRKVGRDHVYYIPDMIVEHVIPSNRITLDWFRKRVFWQAVSDVLASEVVKTASAATEELFNIVARTPAEFRGHRLLSYEPSDPAGVKDQLQAVYLTALLLASGFPVDSLKD